MATVRATIMPGTSPITDTCLPRAWKSPTASTSVSGEIPSFVESTIRLARA